MAPLRWLSMKCSDLMLTERLLVLPRSMQSEATRATLNIFDLYFSCCLRGSA